MQWNLFLELWWRLEERLENTYSSMWVIISHFVLFQKFTAWSHKIITYEQLNITKYWRKKNLDPKILKHSFKRTSNFTQNNQNDSILSNWKFQNTPPLYSGPLVQTCVISRTIVFWILIYFAVNIMKDSEKYLECDKWSSGSVEDAIEPNSFDSRKIQIGKIDWIVCICCCTRKTSRVCSILLRKEIEFDISIVNFSLNDGLI